MAVSRLVRVQEKGQVTLPAELRRKLGIKKGDLVAIEEADGSLLVTPQEVLATQALDEIGEVLRRHGLTLDELIESGRKERAVILKDAFEEMGDQ